MDHLGHLLVSPYVKQELTFDLAHEVDIVHRHTHQSMADVEPHHQFVGVHDGSGSGSGSPYHQYYNEYEQQCGGDSGSGHRGQAQDPIMAALGMEDLGGLETAWDMLTGHQQHLHQQHQHQQPPSEQWTTWAPLSPPQSSSPLASPASHRVATGMMDEGESEDETVVSVLPHTMQHHRQVMNELRTAPPRQRRTFSEQQQHQREAEEEEEEEEEEEGEGEEEDSSSGPAPFICVASFWDLTDEQLATIDFKELTRLMKDAGLSEAQIGESKAKRRRLKNRLSARVCSNKKREKCTELTGTNRQLLQRIKELERDNKKLRKETDSLTGLNHQLSKAASDASQETLQLRTHVQHLSQLLAQAGLLSSMDGAAFAA